MQIDRKIILYIVYEFRWNVLYEWNVRLSCNCRTFSSPEMPIYIAICWVVYIKSHSSCVTDSVALASRPTIGGNFHHLQRNLGVYVTGYLGSSGVSYSSCLQAGHVNIKYKLWRISHPGLCLAGSFTSVAVNPMPLMEDIHSAVVYYMPQGYIWYIEGNEEYDS